MVENLKWLDTDVTFIIENRLQTVIRIRIVLNDQNRRHMGEFIDCMSSLGVKNIEISPIIGDDKGCSVNPERIQQICQKCSREVQQIGESKNPENKKIRQDSQVFVLLSWTLFGRDWSMAPMLLAIAS